MFTIATAGTIQSIEITFPSGVNVTDTKIIERAGIGPGAITIIQNALVYIVNSPVNVPANTPIRLELSNIINKVYARDSSVTITTKDINGTVIDGPTTTAVPLKQIGYDDLDANTVDSSKIRDRSIAGSDIYPYNFLYTDVKKQSVLVPPNEFRTLVVQCPYGEYPKRRRI